jgi:hypothetical protein
MKSYARTLSVLALAIGVSALGACAALDPHHAQSQSGMKLDSGLGDLPHYRDWVDPTGRSRMEPLQTAESTRWP